MNSTGRTAWAGAALIIMTFQSAAAAGWPLALTFDDLPKSGGGDCTPTEIVSVNRSILAALESFRAPAAAFVIPGSSCQGAGEASFEKIAEVWISHGHALGNHSFTHPDYNGLSVESYLADVDAAHGALEPVLVKAAQRERWFRPPLLHMGDNPSKREALEAWLADRNYRLGVVTIDNQEWVFATAYERALRSNDDARARRIAGAYVEHILSCVGYYRALSAQLYGRNIPQVLLLHANRLNADHLGALLAALKAEHADFIPLAEAAGDPAYRTSDTYCGPRGLSWLIGWAAAMGVTPGPEPREPDWIADLAR